MIRVIKSKFFKQDKFIDKILPILESSLEKPKYNKNEEAQSTLLPELADAVQNMVGAIQRESLKKLAEVWVYPELSGVEIVCFHLGAEVIGGKEDGKQTSTSKILKEDENPIVSFAALEFNLTEIMNLFDKVTHMSLLSNAICNLTINDSCMTAIKSNAVFISGMIENKNFSVWIHLCSPKYLEALKPFLT